MYIGYKCHLFNYHCVTSKIRPPRVGLNKQETKPKPVCQLGAAPNRP